MENMVKALDDVQIEEPLRGAGAAEIHGLDQFPWAKKMMEHPAYDAFLFRHSQSLWSGVTSWKYTEGSRAVEDRRSATASLSW